jgi:putative salt-induced outer membrane protein YdiY
MNLHRLIPLLVLLCLTTQLFARDKTDILVMKNGDRITCEVKGLDAGVLFISIDYVDGTTQVDWTKVAKLESKQLFVVKTADGSVYTGELRTQETEANRPVQIKVLLPEHEEVVNRSQVVRMVATSDKFWERFNGDVNFGVIYSKGNESTQFSLGSSTVYVRERWNAGYSFDSNLSATSGVNTSTRNSLALTAFHLLPPKNWLYGGVGGFLQSSEQGISAQTIVGAGIGRYLMNTNRATLMVLGGLAWQNTKYSPTTTPIGTQQEADALVYAKASFFKFSRTNLVGTAIVLPALSDPGRIHTDLNLTFYQKIIGNLDWNVSFYGNWDNQPPPGLSGSDYGTSSGLSWSFGLK